jgi:DNA-binding CsgD family transcriptional regulator
LLSVLPVARCEGLAGTPAKAAIFITEPDARASMDADLIAESFGLTRREAAVAAHLGMGLDIADTAATLAIAIGTVRAHLKQVFEKTGARSQSALVLKLRSYSRTP